MNSKGNRVSLRGAKSLISVRSSLRLAFGLGLVLLLSGHACAQYGGGTGTGQPGQPGYLPPTGGYGSRKAIGIGIGAAAAASGALFFILHHRNHVAVGGCVLQTDGGLSVVDQKKNKSYLLAPDSISLKPGQHVELAGKKSSGTSGLETFRATKLVNDFGACPAP